MSNNKKNSKSRTYGGYGKKTAQLRFRDGEGKDFTLIEDDKSRVINNIRRAFKGVPVQMLSTSEFGRRFGDETPSNFPLSLLSNFNEEQRNCIMNFPLCWMDPAGLNTNQAEKGKGSSTFENETMVTHVISIYQQHVIQVWRTLYLTKNIYLDDECKRDNESAPWFSAPSEFGSNMNRFAQELAFEATRLKCNTLYPELMKKVPEFNLSSFDLQSLFHPDETAAALNFPFDNDTLDNLFALENDADLRKENSEMKTCVKDLMEESETLKAQITQLKEIETDLQKENSDMKTCVQNLRGNYEAVHSQMTQVLKDDTDLRKENRDMKTCVKDLMEESETLKAQISELKEIETDLQKENSDMKTCVQNLRGNYEAVHSQMTQVLKDDTDLRKENSDMKTCVKDLKGNYEAAQSQISELKEIETDLQKENSEMKTRVKDLSSQLAQFSNVDTVNTELQGLIASLSIEKKELQTKMAQLEADFDARIEEYKDQLRSEIVHQISIPLKKRRSDNKSSFIEQRLHHTMFPERNA